MKIRTIEVTPQLLGTAQHTIWYDDAQLRGRGVGVATAPEVFAYWQTQKSECVRFGKIVGLAGGAYATMPLLPELVECALEAQESDPEGVINIDLIGENTDVAGAWRRFLKEQIRTMGNLVVDGLINGSVKPIGDPHRHVRSLQYVASIIDPFAPATHMEPTCYDAFDALSYVGLMGAADIAYRQDLAVDLTETARQIRRGNAATLDPTSLIGAVDELLTNYGTTQTSQVSVR